jgi:type IV pilus assembly protein PilC
MPIYNWSGIDYGGEKISGIDYADNYQQLKRKLSNQNIFLLKIEPEISIAFWHKRKIKAKHITAFIEQLAILINSNTSLITALNIISQDEINEGLKKLITNCKNSISAGQSLHQTLCQHPQYFNELLCSLIYVGEQSGTLDIILNETASYFAKTASQKRKIIMALLYPTTVLSITFIVTAILLLFVIPQFKTLYSGAGASLPSYTQFIIDLGDFVQVHWSFILSSIFSAIVCTKLFHQRSIKFRHYLDDVSLKMPVIGKILTYGIITRLTKTIALSFKSGVPLLKAITISSGTIQNWRYQLALQNISKSVSNGKNLHDAMAEQKLFPSKVIQLIALGEEAGTLDTMLEKIATIYNEEINRITDKLNNLLEPIIMMILGILVGGLVIGMYLPIFRLGIVI